MFDNLLFNDTIPTIVTIYYNASRLKNHCTQSPLDFLRRFSFFSFRYFLAALALTFAFALPQAARAATIAVNAPADWATVGVSATRITLNDGDVLNIGPAAGEPASLTTLYIAADANVTINGNGSLIHNLVMTDAGADTAPHNVSIKNLQISSDPSTATGYTQNMGVLHLTGANAITGGWYGIYANSDLSIESASGGTLAVDGNGVEAGRGPIPPRYHAGIVAPALHILGSAKVTVTSATHYAIQLTGEPATTLEVAAGATLDATSAVTFSGINTLIATTFDIVCNGVIQVHDGAGGIGAVSTTTITGSGTLNTDGTGGRIDVHSLSVTGTTINASSTTHFGLYVRGGSDVALAGGATLNLTGFFGSPRTGFTMAAGTTVTLTNGSARTESHPFTMAAGVPAGAVWQLTNTTPSGASTVSPLTVTVAAGQKGTIKLTLPHSQRHRRAGVKPGPARAVGRPAGLDSPGAG